MKIIYLSVAVVLFAISTGLAQYVYIDSLPVTQSTTSRFEYIATGDINGDGLTDIAGVTTDGPPSSTMNRKVIVWLQESSGKLSTPYTKSYATKDEVGGFVVSNLYLGQPPAILLSHGNHLKIYTWKNNSIVLDDSITTSANLHQISIAAGDFDGDGLIDIAVCHGSKQLTILYQNANKSWDIRNDTLSKPGQEYITKHIVAGKFGPLTQTALVIANSKKGKEVSVFTFDKNRTIQNQYDLQIPDSGNGFTFPNSLVIAQKGGLSGKPSDAIKAKNELWVSYGGNKPTSKVAVWRNLQPLPDSTYNVYDCPESIQAGDLDCDGSDEAVLLHGGFSRTSIVSRNTIYRPIDYQTHYNHESLALGDINNDGANDICIANGSAVQDLVIYYNSRPCWPTSIQNTENKHVDIKIYPNPATDNVYIKSSKKIASVTLSDLVGTYIFARDFTITEPIINVSNLSVGVYLLSIKLENGIIVTRRIVKP